MLKTAGTPATEGTPTMVKKNQEQKGCQQWQDLSNSRMPKTNSMNAKLRGYPSQNRDANNKRGTTTMMESPGCQQQQDPSKRKNTNKNRNAKNGMDASNRRDANNNEKTAERMPTTVGPQQQQNVKNLQHGC